MKRHAKITSAQLALMSLLAEKPMHAYEIDQVIDDRGMREWTRIGFSSIYYLLNKMEKAGWLLKNTAASDIGGPDKSVFSLSPSGRTIWEAAIIEAITYPYPSDNPFLIGISVAPLLHKSAIAKALKTHKDVLEEKVNQLSQKLTNYGDGIPLHVRSMFDLSLRQITASLEWIEIWSDKLTT